jgi:hypothetical protein
MQKQLPAPAAAIAGNRRITAPAGTSAGVYELIGRRIYVIRGQKVMLDSDLAELYRVPTFRLNERSSAIASVSRKTSCFSSSKKKPNL